MLFLKLDRFKIDYTDLLLALSRNTSTCQILLCSVPVCKSGQYQVDQMKHYPCEKETWDKLTLTVLTE